MSDVAHLHKPESSGGLHAGSADIRGAKVAAVAPPAAAVEVESTTPATGERSTGLASCCGPLPASASDDRAGGDSESPSASASAWAGFINPAGHVRTHADHLGARNAGPADVQETAAVASLYPDHYGAVCAETRRATKRSTKRTTKSTTTCTTKSTTHNTRPPPRQALGRGLPWSQKGTPVQLWQRQLAGGAGALR